MPDITKCEGREVIDDENFNNYESEYRSCFDWNMYKVVFICPLRETCYRYTSKASEHWQSYFTKIPFNKKTKECEYYDKV